MKVLPALAFGGVWLLVAACGTDSVSRSDGSSGRNAGAGGIASAPATSFRRSACFACVEEECAFQLENCAFDPGCSGHVACAFSCPRGERGPDLTCLSGCPKPQNSVTDQEIALLFECIQTTACVECQSDGSIGGTAGAGGSVVGPGAGAGGSVVGAGAGTAGSVAGAGAGGTSAGGAGSCPQLGVPLDECDACGFERCCEEKVACRGSAECDTFGACFRECYVAGGVTGAECRAQCKEHATGEQTYFRHLQCGITLCESSCGGTERPCSRCVTDNCAEFYRACLANSACLELTVCLFDTNGARDTVEACFAAHPSGADSYGLYAGCIERDCAAVCG